MDKRDLGEGYNSRSERPTQSLVDSSEFIVDDVIREGSAARYSLLQDRLTALETALRRNMEIAHNTYHVGILNPHCRSWEECGMITCRNARSVLDEIWRE